MKKKQLLLSSLLMLVSLGLLVTSCSKDDGDTPSATAVDMYQVNSIKLLLAGGYDGTVSVGNLRTHGDTGLGCFDKANGEMIVLHDTVYQCTYDSVAGTKGGIKVEVASGSQLVPFADVAWMKSSQSLGTYPGGTMADFEKWLNARVDTTKTYVCTMTGTLSELLVRTELGQVQPYKAFAQVLETDERRFDERDIAGTLVVLYAPYSQSDECGSGWHFHFISSDRKIGGHALNFTAGSLQCEAQQIQSIKRIE